MEHFFLEISFESRLFFRTYKQLLTELPMTESVADALLILVFAFEVM